MSEETQLLKQALTEIKILREGNRIMSARLEMFDSMMLLFTSRPDFVNQGMSPDFCYQIEKYIELKEKEVNQ